MTVAVLLLLFILTFTIALTAVVVGQRFLLFRANAGRKNGNAASGDPTEGGNALEDLGGWLGDLPAIFKTDEVSSISFWDGLLKRLNVTALIATRVQQAELNWSPGRVTLAMLLCGTIAMAIVWQAPMIPTWSSFLAVPAAVLAPYWYILVLRKRRFDRFKNLFPDALDSLARALRSGATVSGALDIVAREAEGPVATEIRKTFVEVNLGVSWERALKNLAERMPLSEVSLFVAALQIHSRTGGRLGDVMNRLSESMREQNSLIGEVRSIAAHGRLTGLVLTLVPIAIACLMMVVSPSYIAVLFNHPYGKHLIAAAGVCLVLAHFVIQKLVDIEL